MPHKVRDQCRMAEVWRGNDLLFLWRPSPPDIPGEVPEHHRVAHLLGGPSRHERLQPSDRARRRRPEHEARHAADLRYAREIDSELGHRADALESRFRDAFPEPPSPEIAALEARRRHVM